jgi:hypothetical protein
MNTSGPAGGGGKKKKRESGPGGRVMGAETRPARGGSGPERVHWEEAGVRCDQSRNNKYGRLDEAHLKGRAA